VRAVRRGDPPPVPGADGRHLQAVLQAAYLSATDHKEVRLDEQLPAYSDVSSDGGSLLVQKGAANQYSRLDG
jgi:hypothetical protein